MRAALTTGDLRWRSAKRVALFLVGVDAPEFLPVFVVHSH